MLLDNDSFYDDLQEFSRDDNSEFIDDIYKLKLDSVDKVIAEMKRRRVVVRRAKRDKTSSAYTIRFY